MKVVHISTTDEGGAYIATERISAALNSVGVDSKVLVRTKNRNTNTIEVINTPYKRLVSKTKNFVNLMFSKDVLVSDWLGTDLSKCECVADSDVIVLHWVNSFVSTNTVYKLARLGKPIFWVMHDMWPFTGGCHLDGYCAGYEHGCGKCPILNGNSVFDISRINSNIKKRLNENVDIQYVALSRWERDCARRSIIIKKDNVEWIPNPINTAIFYKKDRLEVHKKLKITSKKKLLLFGADRVSGNRNKGFDYLIKALKGLDNNYEAYCFGNIIDEDKIYLRKVNINYIGRLSETELVDWYNAVDVMIVSSFQETFCYTCCEALCCGTPVVGFEVGGLLDQISHKDNGYLAKLKDIDDLRNGIIWAATEYKYDRNVTDRFCLEHSFEYVGNLYKKMIENNSAFS